MADEPFRGDARLARQRWLLRYLRIAVLLALAGAAVGVLGPGDVGERGATLAVAVLVAAPLGRAVWLGLRWSRKGDWRFAAAAAVVLAVVGTGALLAS